MLMQITYLSTDHETTKSISYECNNKQCSVVIRNRIKKVENMNKTKNIKTCYCCYNNHRKKTSFLYFTQLSTHTRTCPNYGSIP